MNKPGIVIIYVLFIILFAKPNKIYSQIEFIGDTIEVGINGYKGGDVQWQFSLDNQIWSDIKSATSEKLRYRTSQSGYIRSKISNCKYTYYSDITYLNVDKKINVSPIEDKYSLKNRQWQGIPTIEKTSSGILYAAWYSGGDKEGPENYVLLEKSIDGGKTWSNPILVIDPPDQYRAFDPCLWISPSKELWLFWAESFGWLDGKFGVYYMKCNNLEDNNLKWSKPVKISDGIMLNKPTVRRNGSWLLPIAVWGKASYIYISNDGGNTFKMIGYSQVPERTCDEHMIIELLDNKLWTLVRTSYGIGQSFSSDGGLTWSKGENSGIINANSRFFIKRLKSGKILLIHHNPPSKDLSRSFLTASLSIDDGKSWPFNLLIDERLGVSYPDAIQDENNDIYIIYDYNRSTNKEILYAKIKEDDIISGNISGNSKLKQIISRP